MYGRNLIDYKLKDKCNGFTHESTNIPKMVRKLQDKINYYWSSFAIQCFIYIVIKQRADQVVNWRWET